MVKFLMSLSLMLMAAELPAIENPPENRLVTELYVHALLAEKFSGSKIENVLLSEPDTLADSYRYASEFSVISNGKTMHCEDWHFKLKKAERSWYVTEIARGRCSG